MNELEFRTIDCDQIARFELSARANQNYLLAERTPLSFDVQRERLIEIQRLYTTLSCIAKVRSFGFDEERGRNRVTFIELPHNNDKPRLFKVDGERYFDDGGLGYGIPFNGVYRFMDVTDLLLSQNDPDYQRKLARFGQSSVDKEFIKHTLSHRGKAHYEELVYCSSQLAMPV